MKQTILIFLRNMTNSCNKEEIIVRTLRVTIVALAVLILALCNIPIDIAEADDSAIFEMLEAESHIFEEEEMIIIDAPEELPILAEEFRGDLPDDGIPTELREAAEFAGLVYNICPELLEAVAFYESTYKESVISANGKYYGAWQIHPWSHRARLERLGLTKDDLLIYRGGALVAADYLTELCETYEDVAEALMIYHGEKDRAIARYEESGKMSTYVTKVLIMSEELERIHNK